MAKRLLTDRDGEFLRVSDRAGNFYVMMGTYSHIDNVVTLWDYIIVGEYPKDEKDEIHAEADRIAIEQMSLDLGRHADIRYNRPRI